MTVSRYTGNVNEDNTDRIRNNAYLTPAYAATIALTPTKSNTLVKVGVLTGALTITMGVGAADAAPYVGDVTNFLFEADGTGRTVTFGTGTVPDGTLAVGISKKATASFMFDGVAWIETSRTIQP